MNKSYDSVAVDIEDDINGAVMRVLSQYKGDEW